MNSVRSRLALAAVVAVGAVASASCSSGPTNAAATTAPPAGTAADALEWLPSRPAGDVPGYKRDAFGDGWADADHDCRNTRNEVLARDMLVPSFSDDGCRVLVGRLRDPYTGRLIEFRSGPKTSDDVQIDHAWPLAAAWDAGAAKWSPQRREAYANDELNLLAVDGPTNNRKSDKMPDRWLPPNQAYRCDYVARVVAVGTKYQLAVTSSERAAMGRVLDTCSGQEMPR